MAGNRQQFTLQFNADTTQAKKAVSDLMNSLKDVTKHNSLSLNINADLIKGAEAAQELETHLRSAVNVNTGQLNLVAFNKSLQQSGQSLSTLVTNLANAGSVGQQAFINLATAISQTQVPLRQTNALINNMMTTLKNTVKWELSSSVVHGLEGALSGAVSYVKDLNSSLTDIRIVTGQSVEDMSRFAEQANRAAKELSTTTKAYADASLIYYQQGDSQEQVAKKAALTIKAANASFNTSAAEMSEYLTAVWNSYRVGANELERYVDIMAALGAKTATSLEEIATSMQKVAATANTVGVSMEQVSSIIATVSSVTRESAESIGTSYKTIFARMGDLKLGKTLEDGVGLGQVSKQLDAIGISILDASGDLRDMGDIITDLGNKWQTMSSAEKTATAQVVAGKRQYTQLMALFENWDMYQENMGIAKNSEGSLEEMAKTYAESWEAASNRVKASMETIYSALINDQAMIKMTNVIAEITNGIGSFIQTLGGAKGVLTTVSAILLKTFSGNIVSGVANMTNSIVNLIKGPAKQYATVLADTNKILGDTADGTNKASIQSTSQLIALKQSLLEKEQYLTSAQQATMQAGLDAYAGQIAKLRELEATYEDIGVDLDGLATKLGKFGGAQLDGLLQHLTTVADRWSLLTDSSFTPSSNKAGAFTTQVAKNWTKASITEGVADNAQEMVSEQMLADLSTATQKTEQFKRALEQLNQATEGTKLNKLFKDFDPAKLASGEQSVIDLRNAISQLSSAAEADATALRRALENALNDPTLGDELANSLKEIKQALSSGQIDASEAFTRLQQLFADTESKAEGLKNKLASLPTTLQKVTQSSAQIASGLMSAVSAGTALSNAIRTTGDESATIAEKVGSIVSATSMGLMGIVSMTQAVQGLAVAFGVAQAKAGWIGLIGAGIAAVVTRIMAAVNRAEEKAKKAKEELDTKIAKSTEETTKHTEENNELKALIKEYNTLLERQRAGEDVQNELAISAQKLATAYQVTGAAVAALRGEYDSFNVALRQSLNYSSEYANTLREKANQAGSTLESVDLNFSKNANPAAYTAAQLAQLANVQRDDGWYNVADVIEILGEEYVNKYVLPELDSHDGWEIGDDRSYKIDEGIISYIPSRAGTAYLEADGRAGWAGSVYIGADQTKYSSSQIASDEAIVNSQYADRVSANGFLIWDNNWTADEMVEAYQDYDAWMQELLIKETEGTITDVEKLILKSLKQIVNNSTLSNAVSDYTTKLDLSQNYDLFAGVIDQIIGAGEDTLDFSNDLGTDFISLYQEVEQYIDNNKDSFETLQGLEFGSEEYIAARTKLVNQMFNDYSSLDDYTAIYTALVESFTNQNDLDKAIQFIQDKGIKDASEINGALLTAMQMALDKGVTDLSQDATVNSIYQASKAQAKASQSRTDYQKMLTSAETFSEDMSLDEASQFYDTYWNAGIENIMAWEDFLLLDYEERKAYIDSLTDDYLKTARADADEAKRLAEEAHQDWEESFNELYGEKDSNKRAGWDSHSGHYADFQSSVMANYTQENGVYVYSGPEGKENTGYTYLLNNQGVTGAYNQYYKDQTGTNENANELGYSPEAIEDYNEQAALGVQLTGELDDATSNVAGFDLIANGAESAAKSMSRLVNAIQQLPTDGEELRKIADALFGGDIEALIHSTEAERAAAVAAMDEPVLQQSGRKEYSDVWEYLDAHPELEGRERFRTASDSWREGDTYSTDQDYADYAEQTRLYQEANALSAQYIEQGIRDGAIETLATIEELSSILSFIDISNLPKQGTKAYEQLQKALAKVNISMADFMEMNDSSKYAAIAKAQNKLINEEIAVNKQLQNHYASIMNDTSGKYDEATRMEATQNYYDAVTEGNNLVLQQEQNIANARAQAAEIYAQQADMVKARAEEAKSEAEELKTVAEEMADALETGELSEAAKQTLSQAGYLGDWEEAATAAERAAVASKVWSQYAADTAKAGQELSASYNKTSEVLNNISKGYKAWQDDQSDIKGKDGEMLNLQNKDDYLQYLQDYTNMTEEQLGHISEAWENLETKGIDLSTMTNAEITEALAQELIDMGVEVDQAWQMAAANARDAMADVGKSMAQDHIEAAQTAADAWLDAFNQIAEAREILLSGGSLLEKIAGDPAQILQYAKSSGLDPKEVAKQIMTGNLTASQLQYGSYDDFISTQMAQYGLDKVATYDFGNGPESFGFGSAGRSFDIKALGYTEQRNGTYQDAQGNTVSIETINGALEGYYTAILQTTGLTEEQAAILAKQIISGEADYSLLSNATGDLIGAIEASADAQELYTTQQEALTGAQAKATEVVENGTNTALVNGVQGDKEELTKLDEALERAQAEGAKEDANWGNLSAEDRDLLASYGVTSFDEVDGAAAQCASALATLADVAYKAAETFIRSEEGGGYEQNDNGEWGTFAEDGTFQIDKEMTSYMQSLQDQADQAKYHVTDVSDRTKNYEAQSYGFANSKEWEDYAQRLIDIGEIVDENGEKVEKLTDRERKLAAELRRTEKGFNDAEKGLASWSKDLKNADKSSDRYTKALNSMRNAYADIFNLSDKEAEMLSEPFLESEENAKLLQEAIEGNEESWDKLKQAVAEDIFSGVNLGAEMDQQLSDLAAQISAYDFEANGIKVGASIETAPFYDAINQMIIGSYDAAQKISAGLSSMGVDAKVVEHTQPVPPKTTEVVVQNGSYTWPDGNGGLIEVPLSATIQETDGGQVYTWYTLEGATYNGKGVTRGGSGSGKSSGSGGGGSKKSKETKSKLRTKDEIPRYHKQEQVLDRLGEQLDMIDKLKSRTYGAKHIAQIDAETAALNRELEAQADLYNEANKWRAADMAELEALGVGIEFDENGVITNYEDVMAALVAKQNENIERYNNSEQGDGDKARFEADEQWYEDAIQAIENYEEAVQTGNDALLEMEEIRNQISELELEKITYKLEVETELNENDLELLEYYTDKWEDDLDKQSDRFVKVTDSIGIYQENLANLNTALNELNEQHQNGTINEADYAEGMQDIRDQIMANLENLEDAGDQLKEIYSDALELAREEINETTETIEHSRDVMESYISIMGLMGKANDFEQLQAFYDAQYTYGIQQVGVLKSTYDTLIAARAEYDAKIAAGQELTEIEQANYEALQDQIRDTENEMLSATEATLEAIKAGYQNAVQAMSKDLEEFMVGTGNSIAGLADQYAYFQEKQDRYVSTAKELFEVSKLNREIETSLADATTDASKEALKALQEKINKQSELNELTKYDIQMNQLEYQLLLARIQLEEASSSKDTVRLTRDENGNYAYQYTADQDKVNEAMQQYEDVLQQINELSVERTGEIEQQMIDAMQNNLAKFNEIMTDETLSTEERNQKIADLNTQFSETMLYLQEQAGIAGENLTWNQEMIAEHFGVSLSDITASTAGNVNDSVQAMIDRADEFAAKMNAVLTGDGEGSVSGVWAEYQNRLEQVSQTSGLNYDTMTNKISTFTSANNLAVGAANEVLDTLENTLEPLTALTAAWGVHATMIENMIEYYEGLADAINTAMENTASESGSAGGSWSQSSTQFEDKGYGPYEVTLPDGTKVTHNATGPWSALAMAGVPYSQLAQVNVVPKFKKGGLADFTGLAQLDGTATEPELILNPDDTRNMLETVRVVRQLDANTLSLLVSSLETSVNSMMAFMGSSYHAFGVSGMQSQTLDQNVQITAEFPNVTDHNEIEEAFNSLVNRAAQFAKQK